MLEQETWKPVVDCPEFYEVSNLGRVRSWKMAGKGRRRAESPHIRVPVPVTKFRYLSVLIRINNKSHLRMIHRLVLEAFVGPRGPGQVCRHLNGKHSDNRLENLQWGTQAENAGDALAHGTHTLGAQNGNAKLTAEQAVEIHRRRKDGERGDRLAREFGVSDATICRIKKGIRYAIHTNRQS